MSCELKVKYLDFINDKFIFYNLHNKHIRTPMHNYTYVRSSLLFERIRILQNTSCKITKRIFAHSFESFTFYIKTYFIDGYNSNCDMPNCSICKKI